MVPVYVWTYREFDGTDPWDSDRPTRWSVAGYKMVHPRSVRNAIGGAAPPVDSASGNAVPKKYRMGLVARATGRYRIFPNAVQDLWRAGKVRDEDLPGLLHQVEDRLRRGDYPGSMMLRATFVFGLLMAVYALGGLAAWYFLTPATTHPTHTADVDTWLGTPMQGEPGVFIVGKVPVLGEPIAVGSLTSPAGMHGTGAKQLFVTQAAHEKRMVLATGISDLTDPDGTVLRTGATGIPSGLLRKLQESYPDLNANFVFCTGWEWDDAVSPHRAGEWAWLKLFTLWCGPLAAILLAIPAYFWWRKRTQREIWAALVAGRQTRVNV